MFRAQTAGLRAYMGTGIWLYSVSAEQGSAVTLLASAVVVALGQCNGFPRVPVTADSRGEISHVDRHDVHGSSAGEFD